MSRGVVFLSSMMGGAGFRHRGGSQMFDIAGGGGPDGTTPGHGTAQYEICSPSLGTYPATARADKIAWRVRRRDSAFSAYGPLSIMTGSINTRLRPSNSSQMRFPSQLRL